MFRGEVGVPWEDLRNVLRGILRMYKGVTRVREEGLFCQGRGGGYGMLCRSKSSYCKTDKRRGITLWRWRYRNDVPLNLSWCTVAVIEMGSDPEHLW